MELLFLITCRNLHWTKRDSTSKKVTSGGLSLAAKSDAVVAERLGATASDGRERAIVIRYLVGAWALVCGCLAAFAADRPVSRSEGKPAPMRFEWRMEGPAADCGASCRVWISAIGAITESTVREFEQFAAANDIRGAALVLDSEGGSVLSAMALGRAIRRFEMTTTVGKTATLPGGDDGKPRAALSPKANCESMCAFILLGGTRRYVPPEAQVLVHQIWLGAKSKRALESSYSAEELELVQRDIGKLARYTIEMGGCIELLETALRTPPWQPMQVLSADEVRRLRLATVEALFEASVPQAAASAGNASVLATSAQAQRGNE